MITHLQPNTFLLREEQRNLMLCEQSKKFVQRFKYIDTQKLKDI